MHHLRLFRLLAAALCSALFFNSSLFAETLNGVPVEALARSTVKLPDRTITYIRIQPPALPSPPPAPPAPAQSETAEDRLAELRLAAKPYVNLAVTATTFVGTPTVTELTWTRDNGRRFLAYSNVNFTHLTQLSHLETDTRVYGWFPFVYNGDPADLPAGVREALVAQGPEAQYLFEGSTADATEAESTLQALDYLHAYYQLNQKALIPDTARRQAAAVEQARLAKIKAAQPKDQTIYFWEIEKPAAR